MGYCKLLDYLFIFFLLRESEIKVQVLQNFVESSSSREILRRGEAFEKLYELVINLNLKRQISHSSHDNLLTALIFLVNAIDFLSNIIEQSLQLIMICV